MAKQLDKTIALMLVKIKHLNEHLFNHLTTLSSQIWAPRNFMTSPNILLSYLLLSVLVMFYHTTVTYLTLIKREELQGKKHPQYSLN